MLALSFVSVLLPLRFLLFLSVLQNHQGNDKAWVWSPPDFADEEMKNELFCIRFGTTEKANEFKELFEAAEAQNTKLIEAEGGLEVKEANDDEKKEGGADDLADNLASVKVAADEKEGGDDNKEEEQPQKKEDE